jgi:hypothetical protein
VAKKKNLTDKEKGVEIIALSIDDKDCGAYRGLAGTFAGFADSCLRKKMLPGFYQKGLLGAAEMKDGRLQVRISGRRSAEKIAEVMDVALLNMVAFPCTGGKAEYFIEVRSKK